MRGIGSTVELEVKGSSVALVGDPKEVKRLIPMALSTGV